MREDTVMLELCNNNQPAMSTTSSKVHTEECVIHPRSSLDPQEGRHRDLLSSQNIVSRKNQEIQPVMRTTSYKANTKKHFDRVLLKNY